MCIRDSLDQTNTEASNGGGSNVTESTDNSTGITTAVNNDTGQTVQYDQNGQVIGSASGLGDGDLQALGIPTSTVTNPDNSNDYSNDFSGPSAGSSSSSQNPSSTDQIVNNINQGVLTALANNPTGSTNPTGSDSEQTNASPIDAAKSADTNTTTDANGVMTSQLANGNYQYSYPDG